MKRVDWDMLNRQAQCVIWWTLAFNIVFDIVKEKTTAGLMNAGMMNALLSMYKKPFAVNKVYLM